MRRLNKIVFFTIIFTLIALIIMPMNFLLAADIDNGNFNPDNLTTNSPSVLLMDASSGNLLYAKNIFEKKYSRKKNLVLPSAIGVLFLLLSILIYVNSIENEIISFLMGILACSSVVMIIKNIFDNRRQSAVFGVLAKYTMPIFLMHTIFAASVRTVLFKLEIQDAAIHIVLGIAISFIGPILAATVMKKSKWLEFFLYPGKFIQMK